LTPPAELCTPPPTATPTPIGGGGGTTRTPKPVVHGGTVTVISSGDSSGAEGDTLDGGAFEVTNTTDETETINDVTVELSTPAVVSELTLSASVAGGSDSDTISNPSSVARFHLSGFDIPPGDTATFTLRATLASSGGSSSATATPAGTTTPTTPSPTPTTGTTASSVTIRGNGTTFASIALPGAVPRPRLDRGTLVLCSVWLLALAVTSPRDRRKYAALAALLAVAIGAYASCGITQESSDQMVTDITGETTSSEVTFDGLPASIGSVSRPQSLTFPGAK
jgi:hypothetical protein